MKQKIYELHHADFDGNVQYEFTHPEEFCLTQFQRHIEWVLLKYIDNHIENGGFDKKPLSNDFKTWIGCDTITRMIASKLPELGYIPKQDSFETISVYFSGSSIIEKKSDANSLRKYISEENLKKVIDYNKKIKQSCDEKRRKKQVGESGS